MHRLCLAVLFIGVWGVRIVCVCGILAGHFLVLEPQLFGMEDEAGFGSAAQIIGWGFCWVLGLLCLVTAASLAEKNLEEVRRIETFIFQYLASVRFKPPTSYLFRRWTAK